MVEPPLSQGLVEDAEQPLDVDRLGQVRGRSGRQQLLDPRRHGVGADHDHRDVDRPRIVPELTEHLRTRYVGQVQVQQDHVGVVQPGQLDPEAALHRREHAVSRAAGHDALDQEEVRRVVFDVEDRPRPQARRQRVWVRPRVLASGLRGVGRGNDQAERATLADDALDLKRSSHGLGQPLRQRQPQARPLHIRALGAEPLERDEQARDVCWEDAGAVVAHLEGDSVTGCPPAPQDDGPARSVVLDPVRQKVEEDLLDALPVRHDPFDLQIFDTDLDAALRGQGPDEVDDLRGHLVRRDRLDRERDPARLDPRDVQDLVDQIQQVPPTLQDLLDALALLVVEGAQIQQLAEAQDGVERGPELVAHPRQELALGPVRPLGILHGSLRLGPGKLQRLLAALAVGDVPADRVDELVGRGRGGAPGQPTVRAVLAAVAVLEPDRVDARGELRRLGDRRLAVVGMDEVDERALPQLVQGPSEGLLPGGIEVFEIAVEPGHAHEVEREREEARPFRLHPVAIGDVLGDPQQVLRLSGPVEDRDLLRVQDATPRRGVDGILREVDHRPDPKGLAIGLGQGLRLV